MLCRKKPVVVECEIFDSANYRQSSFLKGVIVDRADTSEAWSCCEAVDGRYFIRTLEGQMIVSEGDYVIKGVKGEFYPCKPDIFKETYELVEE